MDLQLAGKTALAIGATAGIGLAIARTLAREGVAATLTGRDPRKLDAAVEVAKDVPIAASPRSLQTSAAPKAPRR